jgi:hypothetical protein
VAAALAAGAASASPGPDWPQQSFRRAVIGADAHNADRMLGQIAEAAQCGADTVVLTGHLRGEGWFPSELAAYPADLAVGDVVADGTRLAHEEGLRCVFYVGAPLVQKALVGRTDWLQRNAAGQPVGDPGALCLLSPFGEWLTTYLVELASHAPVDGIWLDGYPQAALACACPHCAAAYLRDTGQPLPTSGDPASAELRAYVTWWHGQCVSHARRMVAAIHQANPGCAVFANCATGRSSDAWRYTPDDLCRVLDGPSVEQFWHVDRQGDPLNALRAIDLVSGACGGGRRPEVFVPLLPHTVDCTTVLPRVEALARNLTVLAAGAVPQTTYGPGSQALYTDIMTEIKRREPWLRDARRSRFCGIVASTATGLQFGRDQADRDCWDEVNGWLRALTEEHLPVELLADRQLEEGDFDGLGVVVLPATACLSPTAVQKLRSFVNRGGGLVATSVASLADMRGDLKADFDLADVFGVHYRGQQRLAPLPAFVTMTPLKHPLAEGDWATGALWDQWICLGHRIGAVGLPGRYLQVEAETGRARAWEFGEGQPAVVAGTFGRGTAVYMAPEVGAAYYRNSYPYLRGLMARSVRFAADSAPRDAVLAPLMVQATYFQQSEARRSSRRIIHLLNEASSVGRASLPAGALPLREEVIPVAGVRVHITGPVGAIHLEPEGIALEPTVLPDGRLEVTLPPLGLHSMVVIEPRV